MGVKFWQVGVWSSKWSCSWPCPVRRSSCPRTEVSPAKLAFRDTVSPNSPGAVSLKLVPPGQGNLCPEARTPKRKLVLYSTDSWKSGGCVPPIASLSRHIRFKAFKHIELILELLINPDVSPRSEYANRYFYSSSINGAVVDPTPFDGRRASEQRSPLRNLRSATQSPAIPRRPCLWSSSLQDRETCVLRHEPRKGNLYSVAQIQICRVFEFCTLAF